MYKTNHLKRVLNINVRKLPGASTKLKQREVSVRQSHFLHKLRDLTHPHRDPLNVRPVLLVRQRRLEAVVVPADFLRGDHRELVDVLWTKPPAQLLCSEDPFVFKASLVSALCVREVREFVEQVPVVLYGRELRPAVRLPVACLAKLVSERHRARDRFALKGVLVTNGGETHKRHFDCGQAVVMSKKTKQVLS